MSSANAPDFTPFVAKSYVPKGKIVSVEGIDFYEINPTIPVNRGAAVIILPEYWGWNSGRIRNIADLTSKSGFQVVIPKLLIPPIDGGNDGDGFPADLIFTQRYGDVYPFLRAMTWEVLKPRVDALISHLRKSGVNKIGLVGFSWGTWVGSNIAAEYPEVACFAAIHPEIHIAFEQYHGGEATELMAQV